MNGIKGLMRIAVLALGAVVLGVSATASVAAEGAGMLYMVEFEASEAGAPMTREQAIGLLEELIIPSLERLAKDSRIKAGGLLVGARAGVFIMSAKSHDEVTNVVRALPAWGVWGWKVTPLEGFAHRTALETKIVQDLRQHK